MYDALCVVYNVRVTLRRYLTLNEEYECACIDIRSVLKNQVVEDLVTTTLSEGDGRVEGCF